VLRQKNGWRAVSRARRAACVQIVGPIRSLYWWQDKLDDAEGWLLIIKTTTERLDELEQHIKANHSYDLPEITATQIPWSSAEYLGWVSAGTRQTDVSSYHGDALPTELAGPVCLGFRAITRLLR
jgi:periplasmic divalent cation tolerance protein